MGVKVIDKAAQKEIEVSPAELQADVESGGGRFVVPQGTVRVIREGNRTGKVSADKLGEAIADGWRLSDEAEVATATMRREESDTSSQILGGFESALAGATLGASTWAEANLLGVDPERMAARREGLGSASTVAEVGGALLPALLTGGTSAVGSGAGAGARAGLAARAATVAPAGALARSGALVERGLGAALAEAPGLVRTVVPVAGRGMVEGFAAGVGAEVDDAVLGERDLVAENLLAAGGYGALLGGGAGALVPGLAAAGAGITKVPAKYVREIVGKLSGSADDAGSSLWTRAMTDENLARYAHLNNLDPEDVLLVGRKMRTPEGAKELDRYLNNANEVTEEIADSMRVPFERLRAARAKVRQEFGGQQKILHIERNLPKDAGRLVTAHERSIGMLDELERTLSQASPLASAGDIRSIRMMLQEARDEIGAAARSATGKSGARAVAATTFRALDKVKQGMFSIKDGYRRIAAQAPTRESQVMGELLDGVPGRQGVYDRLRSHLEDTDLWDEAGAIQQALNARSAAAINSRRAIKGSASGRLLDPNRPVVDNADLLSVTRQAGGRFSGATKTELLEDAVAQESAYLDEALKRLDLSPQARAAIAEYRASARQIDDAFKAQREKVRTLDATERFRVAEGNRSPSITGASTIGAEVSRGIGTATGALLGSVLGPAGVFAGAALGRGLGEVASLATRPFTLTRKLAAIRARSSGVKDAQSAAMGGFLKQITEGTKATGRAIGETGSRASKAITQAAGQSGGRNERITAARSRVLTLAGAAGPRMEDEIRKMTLDMEDVAPNVAGVVAMRAQRAVEYLSSKAPKAYQPPYSSRPPVIEPVAAAEFERRVEAVTDPMRSLARLQDGTFTREHAEALRETSPALYRTAQQQVLEALGQAQANGVQIPQQTLTQLTMLGVRADPTLDMAPAIAMALSAPVQPPVPGGAPQQARPPRKVEMDTEITGTHTSRVGTME